MSSETLTDSFGSVGPVVDMDFHLTESEADLREYLEEPIKEMVTREGIGNKGADHYNKNKFFLDGVGGDLGPEYAGSPEAIRRVMSELSLDRATLNQGLNLNMATVHNDRYAAALASAYNEWVSDRILDPDAGMYGTIAFAPHIPERAAEEVETWAGADQFVGAMLGPTGISEPLGHRRYFPVYEALEDAGFPLLLHNSVLAYQHEFPRQYEGTNTFFEIKATGHPMNHMVTMASLMAGGVPERFPDLDIVVMEAGLGYIPYFVKRMDYYYSIRREDLAALEKPPSEYVDDSFYFTTQPIEGTDDPGYVQQIVEWIGADNVMFSSDYPHTDFDNSDALYKTLRGAFDEETIGDIYGGTATEVLAY